MQIYANMHEQIELCVVLNFQEVGSTTRELASTLG